MLYGNYTGARGAVDTDKEVLLSMYAAAYDQSNGQLITPYADKFKAASVDEVRRRFSDLKGIVRRHTPDLLDEVNAIEGYTLDNLRGRTTDEEFIVLLRKYVIKHGISPNLIDNVERRINRAEGVFMPFAPPMPARQAKAPNFMPAKFKMPDFRLNSPKSFIFRGFAPNVPKEARLKPINIAPPRLGGGLRPPRLMPPKRGFKLDFSGLKPIRFNAPKMRGRYV